MEHQWNKIIGPLCTDSKIFLTLWYLLQCCKLFLQDTLKRPFLGAAQGLMASKIVFLFSNLNIYFPLFDLLINEQMVTGKSLCI